MFGVIKKVLMESAVLSSLVCTTNLRCKIEDECSSCILYIVLFSIFFAINVETATYFVYHKYINRNKENVSRYNYIYHYY